MDCAGRLAGEVPMISLRRAMDEVGTAGALPLLTVATRLKPISADLLRIEDGITRKITRTRYTHSRNQLMP
jgi:hypothetical protein